MTSYIQLYVHYVFKPIKSCFPLTKTLTIHRQTHLLTKQIIQKHTSYDTDTFVTFSYLSSLEKVRKTCDKVHCVKINMFVSVCWNAQRWNLFIWFSTTKYKNKHRHTSLTCFGVAYQCWQSSAVRVWAWQLRLGPVGSELVCEQVSTLLRRGLVDGWRCWLVGGSPVAECHHVKRRNEEKEAERSPGASGLLLSCGT